MRDDVTVVIACFNYGAFLPEAVESARGQARVLVVDDGSTDPATVAALDALPSDVSVLRQSNAGVAAARNKGIASSSGTPYVLCLDADDKLEPGAVEALAAALDAEPALGFAYGWQRFTGEWDWVWETPEYNAFQLLYRHQIGPSALMRRQVFEDTGGFDPAFDHFEDWELWLHALAKGWRGKRLPIVGHEYRKHGESKHSEDRKRYRKFFRQLQEKHASLYAREKELAKESGASLRERLTYKYFWGARPLPARVEAKLQSLAWRRRK
jgi:glycosyltransferase involved in cell wall biosynthesis